MKIKKILPLIGIILFLYLIYRIGLSNLISTIKNANLIYLIPGIIVTPLFISVLALKWYTILKIQGYDVKFLYIQKLYYIGGFYGFITPARAGSLMRAYYLKQKTKKSLVECASSIIVERIIDLFVILFFAFIGSLIFLKNFNINLIKVLTPAFVVFLFLILTFLKKERGIFLLSLFYKILLPKNIKDKADTSLDTFYNKIPKIKYLILIFIMTLIAWIIIYFQSYIFAKAFNVIVPFHIFVTFISIGTIIATLPISISGLGTRELTLITLFSLYNVRPEAIVSTSLVSFFVVGLIEGIVGLIFIYSEDKNEILDYNTISS